jgi:quercetin dioxygenase-like cupin family protein
VSATFATELNAPVLEELELLEWSVGDDPDTRGRIATAADAGTGAESMTIVLEVDPGKRIPLHTHSAEETIIVLNGSAIATAGEAQGPVSVGSVIVVPAFAKHGFENTGAETLRLLAFFPAGAVVSWFDEPIAPFGVEAFTLPWWAKDAAHDSRSRRDGGGRASGPHSASAFERGS